MKHFSIRSVLCILVLCMSVTTAAASPTRPSVSWRMENGQRTCYRRGRIYTGWLKKNGRTYYIRRGHILTSWRRIGGKTFYFNENGVLQKDGITGNIKQGYGYAGKYGALVRDPRIKAAVRFAVKTTGLKGTKASRLKKCYYALRSFQYYANNTTAPSAAKIPGYASFMLQNRVGDCYNYAAAMAYIARVLGYPARVSFGGVTAYADHALSAHGLCEVWDDGAWKIIDCSMGRRHTGDNCFMVKRSAYPFRLRIDKSFRLLIKNQKVTWVLSP